MDKEAVLAALTQIDIKLDYILDVLAHTDPLPTAVKIDQVARNLHTTSVHARLDANEVRLRNIERKLEL